MPRRAPEVRLESLLRTACEVIAARGLGNTRAADVASAAGVSQALVFYHFATKERLLSRAFQYAATQDVTRLENILASTASPLEKLRRILKVYLPSANSAPWQLWIDGWAESIRVPEVERVCRTLDHRRREALVQVIADGVASGDFQCPDPTGAAWRITALIDGLATQATVHRVPSRRQLLEWTRVGAARELGLAPEHLT